MSDDAAASERAGSLSPRNTDTVAYRVLKELPRPLFPVGAVFTAWPQGETWANVSTLGIGIVKNGEIADWLSAGLIARETPLTPAQERARMSEAIAAGRVGAETTSTASGDAPERPWPFPGSGA